MLMKKTISRLSILLLLLAVSFGSTAAMAQYRHRHYQPRHGHYRNGDGIVRGIHTAETIAHGAMLGYAIHELSDYTGVRFGYNAASLRTSGSGANADYNSGIDLGLVYGWYLGNSPIIIEPGVYYSKKGSKLNYGGFQEKINMHMLEIPLVLKYDILYPNAGASLQPFAGAYMAFGFGGKIEEGSDRLSQTWSTFDSYDNFDAGLRLGCGLSVDHLYLEIAYDLGLTDMAESSDFKFDEEHRTNTISFNIGFNF